MFPNVYLQAAAPGVREITQPSVNLQPSARTCCAACHDIPACSAFQWCAPCNRRLPQLHCGRPPLQALLLLRARPTPAPSGRLPQVPAGARLRCGGR